MGFISKLFSRLKKTKDALSSKLAALFRGNKFDDEFYEELEAVLISADIGLSATEEIIDELKDVIKSQKVKDENVLYQALRDIMIDRLECVEIPKIQPPTIMMIVGVNGVGKTTAIGKLAYYFKQKKYSVTIAAADTFRAAAADQLTIWAERAKVRIIKHGEGADPSAVVFDAISSMKANKTDILLIDTAGRLHNKKNLMEELKKMSRVIDREYGEAQHLNLIVLDATTGQNAISQVELFNEAVNIDSIVLTKLDGTAKGGVVMAINAEMDIPVQFIGIGEGQDDLEEFDSKEFINAII